MIDRIHGLHILVSTLAHFMYCAITSITSQTNCYEVSWLVYYVCNVIQGNIIHGRVKYVFHTTIFTHREWSLPIIFYQFNSFMYIQPYFTRSIILSVNIHVILCSFVCNKLITIIPVIKLKISEELNWFGEKLRRGYHPTV